VLVHTKHGRNHPEKALAVAINRWLARYSDQVVAVSEDASRVAVEVERIPEKVRVMTWRRPLIDCRRRVELVTTGNHRVLDR
jgi:hypothetical protein